MISLQNLTPEVYYKQSRDFQFIGRLYDIVLNSVKTNADMIYDIPKASAAGSKMIDLLALTLGFKQTHEYNINQLVAICSILPTILRNKGTEYALNMICQAVLTAEGITAKSEVVVNDYHIYLYIPQLLSDINLVRDLLDYVIPAGMTCEIIRTAALGGTTYQTKVLANPDAIIYENTSPNKSIVIGEVTDSADVLTKDRDKGVAGIVTNSIVVSEYEDQGE